MYTGASSDLINTFGAQHFQASSIACQIPYLYMILQLHAKILFAWFQIAFH